jgi:hypothetical protein
MRYIGLKMRNIKYTEFVEKKIARHGHPLDFAAKKSPKPLIFRPFLGQNRSNVPQNRSKMPINSLYRLPAPFLNPPQKTRHPSGAKKKKKKC